MKKALFASPLLAFFVALAAFGGEKPAALSKELLGAKTVHIMARAGAAGNGRVKPDPKRARSQVEDVLKKYGRFQIVDEAQKADLLMIITEGTAPVSAGAGFSPGVAATYSMDQLSDSLAVYKTAALTRDSKPVWSGSESGEDFGWPAERVTRRFCDDWQKAQLNAMTNQR